MTFDKHEKIRENNFEQILRIRLHGLSGIVSAWITIDGAEVKYENRTVNSYEQHMTFLKKINLHT